jgi:hypothetical protein
MSQRENVTPRRSFRLSLGCWISMIGLVILALVPSIASVIVKVQVNTTGNGYEVAMNKDYAKAIGKLTGYYIETEGALNIANANTKAIENIIKAALTGHYGAPADFKQNGLYTAIYQAYPQTGSPTQVYQDAETILVGSFKDYQEADLALYTVVEAFNEWKANSDILLPLAAGYPDQLLSTHVGNIPGTCCQSALAQMENVMADQNTIDAVRTDVLPTLTIPTPAP